MRTGFVVAPNNGESTQKQYLHMIMSADQTTDLTAGSLVLFDLAKNTSGDISFDGFGLITLNPNKVYRIRLDAGYSGTSTTSYLSLDVFNYTNNEQAVSRVFVIPPTYAGYIQRGPFSTAGYIKTGAVSETIGVRITDTQYITKIYSEASGTRLLIEEV